MPESEAKKVWMKQHTTVITIKLNHVTDKDILGRLESQPKETGGKQGYIKRLIRNDIEKEKGNE